MKFSKKININIFIIFMVIIISIIYSGKIQNTIASESKKVPIYRVSTEEKKIALTFGPPMRCPAPPNRHARHTWKRSAWRHINKTTLKRDCGKKAFAGLRNFLDFSALHVKEKEDCGNMSFRKWGNAV